MRYGQASAFPSLLHLLALHLPDGPSLPVDQQLRRPGKPAILPPVRFLPDGRLHVHDDHNRVTLAPS